MQVRWMIIGARSDSLKSQYERLGFLPLSPSGHDSQMVPLVHTGNLLHHVLRFDVTSAERHWHEQSNSLYRFMFRTFHPDLHLLPVRLQTETVRLAGDGSLVDESGSQYLTVLERSSSVNGLANTASIPAAKQA